MATPQKSPIPLDYSSPAQEHRRERQLEDERREALGNYNEATYGERHPFSVWRFLVFCLAISLLIVFLPRWVGRLVAFLGPIAYCVYEWIRCR
jgi:hypothetical protein